MQITGGRVIFSRSVQPAQYETKKAEVEITFTLAEGEALGETLNHAASVAQDKALEMVGLKKSAASPAPCPAASAPSSPGITGGKEAYAAAKVAAEPPPPADKKRPGRPPNPDKPKPEEAKPNISADPENRTDPSMMVDDTVIDTDADDLASMLNEPAPAEPITDKMLIEKIGHKNKSLADKNAGIPQPRKIKELIAKYATHAHSIPADKRQAFLDELEKLV